MQKQILIILTLCLCLTNNVFSQNISTKKAPSAKKIIKNYTKATGFDKFEWNNNNNKILFLDTSIEVLGYNVGFDLYFKSLEKIRMNVEAQEIKANYSERMSMIYNGISVYMFHDPLSGSGSREIVSAREIAELKAEIKDGVKDYNKFKKHWYRALRVYFDVKTKVLEKDGVLYNVIHMIPKGKAKYLNMEDFWIYFNRESSLMESIEIPTRKDLIKMTYDNYKKLQNLMIPTKIVLSMDDEEIVILINEIILDYKTDNNQLFEFPSPKQEDSIIERIIEIE